MDDDQDIDQGSDTDDDDDDDIDQVMQNAGRVSHWQNRYTHVYLDGKTLVN